MDSSIAIIDDGNGLHNNNTNRGKKLDLFVVDSDDMQQGKFYLL